MFLFISLDPIREHKYSVKRQLLLGGKRKSNAPLEDFLTHIYLSAANRLSHRNTLCDSECVSVCEVRIKNLQ